MMHAAATTVLFLACLASLAGCGGQYVLTIPDQVAPTGGHVAAVVRLEQYEFASFMMSVEDAPMRVRVADGTERAAFTDVMGFAGTTVPAPAKPGKYDLHVAMQSIRGDEVEGVAPAYIWAPTAKVLAVELEALPDMSDPTADDALAALRRIAKDTHIVYLTRRSPYEMAAARRKITDVGYPDGPVLAWRQSFTHLTRVGRLRLIWFVTESNLVSRVEYLRRIFPGLKHGICGSAQSGMAMAKAGAEPILVGQEGPAPHYVQRSSWDELARGGLRP